MIVGSDKFRYELVEGWGQLPEGWDLKDACAVAVDSQDRVYVISRSEHPVLVFDRDGRFLTSWGEGIFKTTHWISIDREGSVYCVDAGDHTVRKFTAEGKLLMTLGNKDQPSDTGATTDDFTQVKRGGPPFNCPTSLAFAPSGEFYVSDGYGNARIHKFSPDGTLLFSWGEPGTKPGQFKVPHSIFVDRNGTVYVADRENNRIQLFNPNGEFINQFITHYQWAGISRPDGLFIDADDILYVAELGYRYGLWPEAPPFTADSPLPCVSIWNLNGELLARWGGKDSFLPGNFVCPHGICVDSRGDLYVTEVNFSGGGMWGIIPRDCHLLQKFARIT